MVLIDNRQGDCGPDGDVDSAFGRGTIVDDRLLLGGPSTIGERLFEEGLVGKEGDLECRLKISMKAPICVGKNLTDSR